MNRREKILAMAAASLLGAALAYLLAYKLVLAPARARDETALGLRRAKGELVRDKNRMEASKAQFARLRDRTFDDNPLRASLLVGSRINRLVQQAGMGEKDVTVTPFTRTGSRAGHFSEVGCTVSGSGQLERVIHLLYLLKKDPYLHRVSNLDITPEPDKKSFKFVLRYATLAFDRPLPVAVAARKRPTTQMTDAASLSHPDRAAYDVISRRNVFQPYVPPAPRVVSPPSPPPTPRTPRAPRPRRSAFDYLVVTGLPSRGSEAEVHLATPGRNEAQVFKVGDKLPMGRITMVDYRVLPHPENPKLLSTSRVILKIGRDYWGVELGQRMMQRRLLRRRQLPEQLKPKVEPAKAPRPTTRPAKQA